MRVIRSLFILCVLALGVAISARATGHGTPDGQPPSAEHVCDGLQGAQHGLCTAYCEAMDCDSAAPHASQAACASVLENYLKHSKGVPPPCACGRLSGGTFTSSVPACAALCHNEGAIACGQAVMNTDGTPAGFAGACCTSAGCSGPVDADAAGLCHDDRSF